MTAIAHERSAAATEEEGQGSAPTTAAADVPTVSSRCGAARPWPLLILAVPAAVEVWSGWVGIARMTGFGLVSPLPGIWPSLRIDTAVTLPVGVEAYAAYALRAWLTSGQRVSARTRRFAKWSAIFSFALGMAGQVAYHLLAQSGTARAPWAITTVVSCLPVLVLAMGSTLAHMLHADSAANSDRSFSAARPASFLPPGSPSARSSKAHGSTCTDGQADGPPAGSKQPAARPECDIGAVNAEAVFSAPPSQLELARAVARGLAAEGKRASRRTLRCSGVRGSNEVLNALASAVNAELAGARHRP